MYSFFDLKDKVKRYFEFSNDEIKGMVVATIIVGFIISFKEWGYGDKFDAMIGLKNLFSSILIVALSMLAHISGQRIAGLHAGFRVKYNMWLYGLVFGLIIVLVTRGNFWFIAPGGITIILMEQHRIGYFRYGINKWALAMIAAAGPVSNIILAGFFKTIQLWFTFIPVNGALIDKLFVFNLVFAAYSLLPIPPLDGTHLFFASRLFYAFVIGTVGGYALLVVLLNVYSYLWALIIGVIVWQIFYWTFEKQVW